MIGFGILAIAVGLVSLLGGVLQLVLALVAAGADDAGIGRLGDPTTFATGGVLYLLLGAAFVCLGAGSVRKRRWVPRIMLVLAWSWLLCGALALVVMPALLDGVLSGAPDLTDDARFYLRLAMLAAVGGFGVLLPAAFVWSYRDPDLLRTCEASDPHPSWTDNCPVAVLGLSVGLGGSALLVLPMVLRPVVPWFGRLVTGGRAALLLVAFGATCAGLARATYRLRPWSWWATSAFLLLIGISTALTAFTASPAELWGALDPSGPAMMAPGLSGPAAGWLTLVVTALSLAYMAGMRRHFVSRDRTTPPD